MMKTLTEYADLDLSLWDALSDMPTVTVWSAQGPVIRETVTPVLEAESHWVFITAEQAKPASGQTVHHVAANEERSVRTALLASRCVLVDEEVVQHAASLLRACWAPVVILGEQPVEGWPLVVRVDDRAAHREALIRLIRLMLRTPSFVLALRRRIAGLDKAPEAFVRDMPWVIDGPFDSSYSLAIVNRELGRALRQMAFQVGWSDPALAQRAPETRFLSEHERKEAILGSRPLAPIVLRDTYPPETVDMRGVLNLYNNYAWEESGFPVEWIERFNATLDGMTVISPFVRDLLRNHGLTIPACIMGCGVDHLPEPVVHPESDEQITQQKTFTFVHISSCFPRKGVDVLLRAWAQAFDRRDPVRLIIKTFPNPHNNAPEACAWLEHQHPDHAPVELIMEDWPEAKISRLLQSADALVAPSRAEGFGMPMAEAMYYRVPVITTAWGGQRMFCNERTAWLVDFRFAHSTSHLSTPHSVWAEPDVDDLADKMRAVFQATPQQRRQRTDAAYRLIQRRFRWSVLGEITRRFATHLLKTAPAFWPEPRVLWLSTYNSRCGIAAYSEGALKAFPADRVHILADRHSKPVATDPDQVSRVLTWSEDDLDLIREALERFDTVVVQHHPAFYGIGTLGALIQLVKAHQRQIFVTFHNTRNPVMAQALEQHAARLRLADRILVHSLEDLNQLKRCGLVENVCLFPQGVFEIDIDEKLRSMLIERYELEGQRLIATFGFLMPHKGVRQLVEAFARLAEQDDTLRLLLLNSYHPNSASEQEKQQIDALIERLGLEGRVIREHAFLSERDIVTWLSLATLVVFPYQHTSESSSAAVRMAISARRPILVTPLSIFSDVREIVQQATGTDPEALADAMSRLLARMEREGEDALIRPVVDWYNTHRWSVLSRRLWNMLKGLHLDHQWSCPAASEIVPENEGAEA